MARRAPRPRPEPITTQRERPPQPSDANGKATRAGQFDTSRRVPYFKSLLNDYQEDAWALAKQRRITLFLGPAGTAKTHVAVAMALHALIAERSVTRLIFARPAVEAGEHLGFMPGTLVQKVDPYLAPIYDILDELLGKPGSPLRDQVDAVTEKVAIAFLRGRTFKNAFIILDESQNCSWKQLKLATSRIGKGSRMVVTGDTQQSDLENKGGQESENPLARLMDNIQSRGLANGPTYGAYVFPEAAIVRDEAVKDVLRAFE